MGSLSFVMYFWQTYYNTKIILYVIFFEKVVKWCYLLQHIKNVNYDREDILSNDMGGKPRKNVKKYKVSNVKELLNIMIKIIFKYDPTNKRINLVQMEQLLLENNINIKELGFSDLKQFAELVHNTIYCYSFGNNEFLRINTEDKKRAYNMKKKRYRRNF